MIQRLIPSVPRVIPLLLVAYLLPFTAFASGNITFSASTTNPTSTTTLFIATPTNIQYPPYYGCLFSGSIVDASKALPAPGFGTEAVSTTTDLINQFYASESPDLLTYLSANPGLYTLAVASGGSGNCLTDVVPNYSMAGTFNWQNGFAGNASTTETAITWVDPYQDQTVATGTPLYLEAIVSIKPSDATTDLLIHWKLTPRSQPIGISQCADVACATEQAGNSVYEGNFVITPGTGQIDLVSTTTIINAQQIHSQKDLTRNQNVGCVTT